MVEKIIEKVETVKHKVRFCDICGKEIITQSGLSVPQPCLICKRDVCKNHIQYDYSDGGDYPSWYCVECWGIGIPFREKMKELEDKHYDDMEKLEKEWAEKARKKAQEK